jgi:hypothetical protein
VYLVSLDISFFDNNSNQLIAHGSFQNGKKHTFPNVKKTVDKVVNSVFDGVSVAPRATTTKQE